MNLNTGIAANLVLAMGFSVDYSAHVSEAFCLNLKGVPCQGKRVSVMGGRQRLDPERAMCRALATAGFSVMNGGISTALSVAVLAFSSTKAFQDLFKTFFLMVALGLSHGLLLVPILLVYFQRGVNWLSPFEV